MMVHVSPILPPLCCCLTHSAGVNAALQAAEQGQPKHDRVLSCCCCAGVTELLCCPGYMSPEAMGHSSKFGYFCSKSDIWSTGCVLYELLTGFSPFDSWNSREQLSASQQLQQLRFRHRLLVRSAACIVLHRIAWCGSALQEPHCRPSCCICKLGILLQCSDNITGKLLNHS